MTALCGSTGVVVACDKREAFAQGSEATKQSILSLRGEMDCVASLARTVSGRARHTSNRHRPPPGRRIAPPDDRLRRAIQYSETSVMESKNRCVLDTPACAGYDGLVWEHRRRHCLRQTRSVCARERSDEAIHSFFARRDGLLRFARNDGVRTNAPHSQPSSSAKAGDPVFRGVSDGAERPRRTGYSAFAEYDEAVHSSLTLLKASND